ncbi:MAG: monovalent cation/H+ antiporter subunit D family protein, partial [Alphaproteobacteria bacterium]|nr:monovalent cation/H+ antiporter subunit D family protein [Alphaproteobacteria bacterium]
NAAYFLPVTYTAFFEKENAGQDRDAGEPKEIREIPLVAAPLVATALLSLLMGLYPGYFLTLARGVVG